jgi:hypothetical protein
LNEFEWLVQSCVDNSIPSNLVTEPEKTVHIKLNLVEEKESHVLDLTVSFLLKNSHESAMIAWHSSDNKPPISGVRFNVNEHV